MNNHSEKLTARTVAKKKNDFDSPRRRGKRLHYHQRKGYRRINCMAGVIKSKIRQNQTKELMNFGRKNITHGLFTKVRCGISSYSARYNRIKGQPPIFFKKTQVLQVED